MKKFLTSVLIWVALAACSYGLGYTATKFMFHLSFTTQVVNPILTQGKEFELANKLDRTVELVAVSAEDTAGKLGGVASILTFGVISLARGVADAAKKESQVRSRYQSLLGRVASMKRAYNSNDMDGFTTIATTLVQESDDDSVS